MIRHYLTCLLALLIALQSAVAMADTHRFHQSGTEHLEFDHTHPPTDTPNNSQLAKQTANQPDLSLYDCRHCCHCHGQVQGAVVLTGAASHLAVLLSGNGQADYQANLTSGIFPSLFRPPIA
ncbi:MULTISPECIES: hypothetical protein [Marinobacter]|uniref:DUF2946 domain-containing protein n=1 Tax=Marinobacter metalliresistant TaxID=2961995 RepID=A0ABZ2W6P9_9GAMM|nr:hypothetical protein [Marinobacter sp. Arc7-DN-1]AXS83055.1 hypothetical protein D0851_08425 [Marinobacter sp. Arc7-DN-1]